MISLIFQKNITLPQPSDDDRRAHDQRIRDALGLAPLAIPLGVLRKTASLLNESRTLMCIIGRIDNAYRLIDIGRERSYSIALDLGTTNLVGQLYDNISKRDVLMKIIGNPQIAYGSDVITRMQYSMTDRANDDVARVLMDGINSLIAALSREAGIDAHDIHAMTVAGNTVMSHYFLGLDISTIPVNPFVPVVRTPGFLRASELSLALNPEAIVYVFPNAGSYVGGDITAGILASGMFQSEKISILIDVGTNAEIVIGNKEWMIVGAGAAGPALEEGISRIGKRAQKGIIYDVEIRGSDILCKTFDEAVPEGICGSGMVSLLYELYNAGIIDESGALKPGGNQVINLDGERAFAIACTCEDFLYIRQSEIQNFLKSKAAMFTLLLVLIRSVGIAFRDISSVYVSGALGTGINAEKAVGIGMIPAWPAEIVRPLGNSSLAGARMLLANGDLASTVSEIVARITYKHMNDDPEFMKEYLGAVFIPHTNPELLRTK